MADTNGAGEPKPRQMNIGGRYGSPTVTIALPFSRVTRVEGELREELAELATIVSRLAAAAGEPGMADELATVRDAAQDLAKRLAETE